MGVGCWGGWCRGWQERQAGPRRGGTRRMRMMRGTRCQRQVASAQAQAVHGQHASFPPVLHEVLLNPL